MCSVPCPQTLLTPTTFAREWVGVYCLLMPFLWGSKKSHHSFTTLTCFRGVVLSVYIVVVLVYNVLLALVTTLCINLYVFPCFSIFIMLVISYRPVIFHYIYVNLGTTRILLCFSSAREIK